VSERRLVLKRRAIAAAATPIPFGGSPGRCQRGRNVRRRRSHRSFWSIAATEGEVILPRYVRLGFLEQAALVRAAQAGDLEARNTLWLRHARLPYVILNRHRVPTSMAADALQAGQLGVLRAIELFDLSRLADFSTYAAFHVRARVQRMFRKHSMAFVLPDHLAAGYFAFRRSIVEAPTRAAWFDAREQWLDRNEEFYHLMLRAHAAARATPLGEIAPRAVPAAAAGTDPADDAERRDMLRSLERALDALTPRDREIIRARHGLGAGAVQSLRALGEQFGYTRERIRQLQRGIEERLRNALYHRGPSP